jgi:hypothetical protein
LLESQKEEFELDAGLFELRRKYMEMKKDRQRTQKDADLLTNKLKLLENEEIKVMKKGEKERKTQEELEKIRSDIMLEKEMLYNSRLEKEKEISNKKNQILSMRETIKCTLTSWRGKLQEKNKNENEKLKLKKIENSQLIDINKKEQENKNRDIVGQIKIQKLTSTEKKKQAEVRKFFK